eukprot:7747089-Heterocapsa_arctica.AAC.1
MNRGIKRGNLGTLHSIASSGRTSRGSLRRNECSTSVKALARVTSLKLRSRELAIKTPTATSLKLW